MRRNTFILFALLSFCFEGMAQNKFNKQLADSLHADDYGMKKYVLTILKTGSNQTKDKTVTDSLFRGHMDNIGRLAKEGKLVIAGPIVKNEKNYRGIFILNASGIDEAQKMVQTDPAIAAHIFDVEFYEWYGSAALPMYLPYHEMISKENP